MEVRALARGGALAREVMKGWEGIFASEGTAKIVTARKGRVSSENRWLRQPGTAIHSNSIAGSASPVTAGDLRHASTVFSPAEFSAKYLFEGRRCSDGVNRG